MFDIRQLFARATRARGAVFEGARDPTAPAPREGLEIECQDLITAHLCRLGICDTCATVDVRRLGKGPHGFDAMVGMVRLYRWERTSALRLLVGLPLIEAEVRTLVRGTWLADYSHFGGLSLHASEQLHEHPGMEELRELLLAFTPPAPADGPVR